jgi:hypothetical protein
VLDLARSRPGVPTEQEPRETQPRVSDNVSAAADASWLTRSTIGARRDASSSAGTRGMDAKDVAAQKTATMTKKVLLIEERL